MSRILKIAFTTALLTCLVMALLMWSLLQRKPQGGQSPSSGSPAPLASTNGPPTGPSRPRPAQDPSRLPPRTGAPNSRSDEVEAALSAKNVPVSFWGKVVAQDDTPVPDVSVVLRVRRWFATPAASWNSQEIEYRLTTDSKGQFSIQDARGDSLSVESMAKDGYELSPKACLGFSYGGADSFRPNAAQPVIFKMWRPGEPQSLLRHRLSRVGIPCDGQPTQFDLLTGSRVSEGGHFIVRFQRDPQVLPNGTIRYDWSAEFEVPGGGLVPSDDQFMYQAPADGYRSSFRLEMARTATNWISTLQQQFYVKLNGGAQYGRVNVRLSTHYSPPPTGLTLDISVNPTGSRSLQP